VILSAISESGCGNPLKFPNQGAQGTQVKDKKHERDFNIPHT